MLRGRRRRGIDAPAAPGRRRLPAVRAGTRAAAAALLAAFAACGLATGGLGPGDAPAEDGNHLPDADALLPDRGDVPLDDAPPDDGSPADVADVSADDAADLGDDDAPPADVGDDVPSPGCGNGIREAGEECDEGSETAACDADCTAAACGDGWRNAAAGEACDGTALDGRDCAALGLSGGPLRCNAACTALDVAACSPNCPATLGPDPFGYVACAGVPDVPLCDSITGVGVPVPLADPEYGHALVPLEFPFDFYGVTATVVAVSADGTLSFADEDVGWANLCLPGAVSVLGGGFVAAWWDDLDGRPLGSSVLTATLGTAPSRRFVVQWTTFHWDAARGEPVVFRAVLFEGSHLVRVCYEDTVFGLPAVDHGAAATTGIQQSFTTALQFSCNEPDLMDGLVIDYRHP